MSNSFKRIGAIFIKETQDITTNINIIFMFFLPILLLFIYKTLIPGYPPSWSAAFAMVMLAGEVGTLVPSMLIAEEKEKRTLEVLMLSPAKPVEIFAGKGLLTLVSMVLFTIVMAMISGAPAASYPIILLGTLLCSISCIILGMIIGLLSQNQMTTGIIGLPVFMPLILLPFLSYSGNEVLLTVNRFIPTYHYYYLVTSAFDSSRPFVEYLPFIGALVGSIMITLGLLLAIYRKKGFDR